MPPGRARKGNKINVHVSMDRELYDFLLDLAGNFVIDNISHGVNYAVSILRATTVYSKQEIRDQIIREVDRSVAPSEAVLIFRRMLDLARKMPEGQKLPEKVRLPDALRDNHAPGPVHTPPQGRPIG